MMLFDFLPWNKKGKAQFSAAARGDASMRACQEKMPLANVEGMLARLRDGSTCVYLTLPGKNLSLMTDEDRMDYALLNGQVLATISADTAGILLFPERVKAESNLMLVDRRIAELADLTHGATSGDTENERCLAVLEQHIRPEFARDAVASESIEWRTYLGLRYESRTDERIRQEAYQLSAMIRERIGAEPRILEGSEILDLIDLYFKGSVPPRRVFGTGIVMPEID